MEAATVPQTEKYLVKNNTAGHVGVVVLNHKDEEVGENIEPFGTRYMSEAELILTARAPRRPEDNPFEEQTFIRVNPDTQAREEFKMRTLTIESDGRVVPVNDRYVPTAVPPEAAEAAPDVARTEAAAPVAAPAPVSTGSASPSASPPPPPPPVVPPQAPVPTSAQASQEPLSGSQEPVGGEEERQSWVEPPQAPGEVLHAPLGGSDEGSPAEAAAAPDPTHHQASPPPVAGQAQAAPQTPGADPAFEERAQAVDPRIGEETGAARPPAQPQPEGEYASREEVGSPAAPGQTSDDQTLVGE